MTDRRHTSPSGGVPAPVPNRAHPVSPVSDVAVQRDRPTSQVREYSQVASGDRIIGTHKVLGSLIAEYRRAAQRSGYETSFGAAQARDPGARPGSCGRCEFSLIRCLISLRKLGVSLDDNGQLPGRIC